MRTRISRLIVPIVGVVALMAVALPASADHGTRTRTFGPLTALGDSENVVESDLGSNGLINSDLAFWGDRAYQGGWHGFRIIDISNPASPAEIIKYEDCGPGFSGQGDLIVHDTTPADGQADTLVWAANSSGSDRTCDGEMIPNSFEGIVVFDISNESDPDLLSFLETNNGTHTITAVPDPANNRLLIYSNSSSGNGFEVISLPNNDRETPELLRTEPAIGNCHDVTVFLGNVNRVACAGGSGTSIYSIGGPEGGSLVNPKELYGFDNDRDGISLAHSAAFTWDGKRYVIGHEPGGGSGAECDDNDRELERTLHYYDTATGTKIGQWVIPNEQTSTENCTTHNFQFIPTLNGRDILVSGHYQAGTYVTDFTDPKNTKTIAYSDPDPLDPENLILGGAWSTYWYNGFVYETDITKGLHVWSLGIPEAQTGGYRVEASNNPQTQLQEIALGKCRGEDVELRGTGAGETIPGTSVDDVISGRGGADTVRGGKGADTLCGNGGKDTLRGGKGFDVLVGGPGKDTLVGGPGFDVCIGNGGKDKARGCEVTRSI